MRRFDHIKGTAFFKHASSAWLGGVWDSAGKLRFQKTSVRVEIGTVPLYVAEHLRELYGGTIHKKVEGYYIWKCDPIKQPDFLECILLWSRNPNSGDIIRALVRSRGMQYVTNNV